MIGASLFGCLNCGAGLDPWSWACPVCGAPPGTVLQTGVSLPPAEADDPYSGLASVPVAGSAVWDFSRQSDRRKDDPTCWRSETSGTLSLPVRWGGTSLQAIRWLKVINEQTSNG